jgi:hypothetical protein
MRTDRRIANAIPAGVLRRLPPKIAQNPHDSVGPVQLQKVEKLMHILPA